MKSRYYDKKGVVLFVTLSILLLLSMGAVVVLLTAYNYANVTENQIRRARAIALAEAGINYVYWKIRVGQDDNGDPISYPCAPCTLNPPISLPAAGWAIQVDITGTENGRKTVESKVTYPKATVF